MDNRAQARFMAKVEIPDPDGCWLWVPKPNRDGYGQFLLNRRHRGAHCASYEHFIGPIPERLELDHLCRVRHCVRPDHLEPITHAENMRRCENPAALWTHCKSGHLFDEANTYISKKGNRSCRSCHRRWTREWREKRVA